MTRGLSCAETSALLRSVDDGSVGNWLRSSNSGSPVLTSAGIGAKDTTSTVPTVVRMPLTTSSVDKKRYPGVLYTRRLAAERDAQDNRHHAQHWQYQDKGRKTYPRPPGNRRRQALKG